MRAVVMGAGSWGTATAKVLSDAGTDTTLWCRREELAERISRPPHNWTTDFIWAAYETIDVGRVRHSDRHTLTDLVSLLRYTVGLDDELVPYAATRSPCCSPRASSPAAAADTALSSCR